MLGVAGSSLKMVKFEPTAPNMSQQGGQTYATCCTQQCCDMLRWHVVIVLPGLNAALLEGIHVKQNGIDVLLNVLDEKFLGRAMM